ncbi:MAG: GNAT family N-acetyltransferase [Gammaproteobacteria bacterium]|nr:GNAT family N-acetyltransferase [Gammaproteobacteria bacterium]
MAYAIRTPRLLLRCWSPEDAPRRRALIDSSDAHLRPYIPWMRDEPLSLSETAQRLREYRADFDLDQTWRYAVLHEDTLVGDVGLFPRVGIGALEVGYLLGVGHTGQGFATEAVSAMLRIAFEVAGVDRVEIRCDPGNEASVRMAKRLGFKHEACLPRRYRDEHENFVDLDLWSLFASNYPTTVASTSAVYATDCMGMPLLGSTDNLTA